MKTLRKIIPLLLLGATTLTTTGCSMYHSKAAEKSWFVGTYELDVYKFRRSMNSDEEPYDRKAEDGIKAYFTLDIDGCGYYGYKDNDTSPWISSVFSHYIQDDEKPELFEAIKMQDGSVAGDVYEWDWKVGCLDEPTMGFMYQEKQKSGIAGFFGGKYMEYTLSYTIPQRHNNVMDKDIHYQYVSYKKISDETGLDPINGALGTSIEIDRPYELKKATGCLIYRCQPKDGTGLGNKGHYEYAIVDMSSYSNGSAPLYYSYKDNPGQHIETVRFERNEVGVSMKTSIFGKQYITSGMGLGMETSYDDYPEESDLTHESFSAYYSQDLTLQEVIEQELNQQSY